MVGVGITPEGINQNYVIYEFALDRAWHQDSTDVFKWINEYTLNRYGFENEHVQKAWHILKASAICSLYTVLIACESSEHFLV